MAQHGDTGFNYSYYMRIENENLTPSKHIVQAIVQVLAPKYTSVIIQAYCKDLFPDHEYLFVHSEQESVLAESAPAKRAQSTRQKELTPKQVAQITKSKTHYYLFLLVTLSRHAIRIIDLEKIFKSDDLSIAISELQFVKLVYIDGKRIRQSAFEYRFPAADSHAMKNLY